MVLPMNNVEFYAASLAHRAKSEMSPWIKKLIHNATHEYKKFTLILLHTKQNQKCQIVPAMNAYILKYFIILHMNMYILYPASSVHKAKTEMALPWIYKI